MTRLPQSATPFSTGRCRPYAFKYDCEKMRVAILNAWEKRLSRTGWRPRIPAGRGAVKTDEMCSIPASTGAGQSGDDGDSLSKPDNAVMPAGKAGLGAAAPAFGPGPVDGSEPNPPFQSFLLLSGPPMWLLRVTDTGSLAGNVSSSPSSSSSSSS